MGSFEHTLDHVEQLADLYRAPGGAAVAKETDRLDEACRAFIARSTFVLVGTSDADGNLDVVTSSNDGLFIHPGYGEGEFGTGFTLRDVPTTLVETLQLDSDTAPDIITFSPNRAALLFGDP